jgi:hypothetical protein
MRLAAACAWASGLGFGLPAVYGTWYFAQHDEVWTFAGFPAYGDGPFEQAGIDTSVPLLAGFTLVCAAEVVLGFLLWRRRGVGLSFALLPLELAFWIGFALPFGFVFGAARTVLVLVGRRTARAAAPRMPSASG